MRATLVALTAQLTPDNQTKEPIMANHNFIFRDISTALPPLLEAVLAGDEVGSRGGRTMELISTSITLTEPWRREVLTPLRRASLPAQIAETMWLLAGRDDIEWLSNYLPRAVDFSDDGKVWRGAYGPRLRAWKRRDQGDVLDQLAWVVDLLRKDPLTRRAVMAIYDPDVDSTEGGLDHPCNDVVQFTSRLGLLDAHVFIRSNDALWGLSGINCFEWSAVQEIVAGLLGIRIGSLHIHQGSFHLYEKHWGRAERIVNADPANMEPAMSPRFDSPGSLDKFDELVHNWFQIEEQLRLNGNPSHRDDKLWDSSTWRLVEAFPEPMLQSWLRVIGWWWSGDNAWLVSLKDTALYAAALLSPKTFKPEHTDQEKRDSLALAYQDVDPFTEYLVNLHAEKHKVYGDSWKRRGEQIGILANIARKIDRLGVAGAGDTAADTVVDLTVYLVLYYLWLNGSGAEDEDESVNEVLRSLSREEVTGPAARLSWLKIEFERLDPDLPNGRKRALVNSMLRTAAPLARHLWVGEQGDDYKGADAD